MALDRWTSAILWISRGFSLARYFSLALFSACRYFHITFTLECRTRLKGFPSPTIPQGKAQCDVRVLRTHSTRVYLVK